MSKHSSSTKKTGNRSLKVPQAVAVALLLLSIFTDCSLAILIYSGETYSFAAQTPPYGSIYTYEWSVADGYPTKCSDRVFNWTAPNVDTPKDVAINITITDRGCWASKETVVTVIPQPIGQISLEKSLDGDRKDVLPGDTISYTINITNTGQNDVVSLPLVDYYPIESLKPLSSIPAWKEDNGSALIWNNLLDKPLVPGESFKVHASFRAIAATGQTVINLARVEGAIDDNEAVLEPQEASSIIAAIQYECPKLGPDTACCGEEVLFSAPLGLESYGWMARDANGTFVGGFNDSTKADVTWTPPGPGTFEISFNDFICRQTVNVRQRNSSIRIDKSCDYEGPVHIGDAVTYGYNITNTGELELTDVKVTDIQNWGPECLPMYAKGDDGDGVLDPGEMWRYECRYVVADPLDYPVLRIMSAESSFAKTKDLIRRLMDMKDRLEITMSNLKLLQGQFDIRAASLAQDRRIINEVNYTSYNYKNQITGESLLKKMDPRGDLNETIYKDPLSGVTLTTKYGSNGRILSEELYFPPPGTKEYYKIEYDMPIKGYNTITITDYETGDTLLLMIDKLGNILNKEYKKTPGYKLHEERLFLKNTATVTAKSQDGREVSDSDSFTLEISRPLPVLKVTKGAQPNPINPDGILDYTIYYENTGADAKDVVLLENYSKSLVFLQADPAPDLGATNRWTIGDLRKGESGEIKIKTKVSASSNPGEIITNIVNMTCKEGSFSQAAANTTIAGIGMNITKKASSSIIPPGESFTYTITYRNVGQVKLTGVVMHDYLDPNVDFIASHSDSALINGSAGKHHWWRAEELNPGEGGTIEIYVKAKEKSAFTGNATSIFNTYRMNSSQSEVKNATLETLVIHSLWIKKSADKDACSTDDNITYLINYGNSQCVPAERVNITDLLPEVDLISASPAPDYANGNNLTWRIGTLNGGKNGTIVIVVHVPKKPKTNFDETSSVRGEGYVYVRKRLSTEEEKNSLINQAMISGYYGPYLNKASCSLSVTLLGAAGTKLSTIEHGSGYYKEEQKTTFRLENKRIGLDKSIYAKHEKTTFSLPGNRSIKYDSLWSDLTSAENQILNDVVSEEHRYVDTLSKNSSFKLDMNQTVYKSEGDFNSGKAQISYKKHASEGSDIIQEIDENYHGSFRLQEALDSYGESVKFSKSSIGKGFVSSDKRVNGLQRSYESGSGYYSSEEASQLGSVDKITKMQYAPVLLRAGLQNLSYANLWNEGMWTKDAERGLFISEKILYASFVDKEAAMEKSSLSLLGKFNGTLNMQLVNGQSLDLDQTFIGSFQIDTAISVYTIPRHLYPHVNICKKAVMLDENTVLFLINVSNDGNKLLKPLNVTDYLPEGCNFINSSIRAETNGRMISWTIPSLDIGRMLTIKMRAKVDGEREYYTNTVSVRATCKESILEAKNSTTFEAYYQPLPCCPGVDAGKDSKINATKLFNATQVIGYWGEWKPSPYFNLTANMTECSCEVDAYYNELEKDMAKSCCASNYEVP
jgi:uncharacterized repeat protein (TIGR01451 family)